MKLSYKRTIFVGFAFFLICAFWQAYDTIVPKILTDKFGMNQTLSGAIMALDNVLALFMLPLFGSLSDKSKSKRGRRTPFIMTGTIIACAAFICMSIADGIQLRNLKAISPETPNSQEVIYLTEISDIRTPDGESVNIREKFTKEEFAAISMYDENGNVSADYTNYVVPARRACVHKLTMANPPALIMFIAALLVTLIAMSTFRSPAVALMPDVTVKPLRSKANAVINLMGALGGVIVLALGIVFGTGRSENAMMSYLPFFCVIAGIMLVSLAVFRLTVKEPEWAAQAHDESLRLGIENEADDEAAMSGSRKLTKSQLASLILILASVALWYMGYNAVMSKYSLYASAILGLDYNTTLMIATGVAVVSYIPIGFISSKFGRKKTIMAGVFKINGTSENFLCRIFYEKRLLHACDEHSFRHGGHRLGGDKCKFIPDGSRAFKRKRCRQIYGLLLYGKHGGADSDTDTQRLFHGYKDDIAFHLCHGIRRTCICDHGFRAPRRQHT